MIGHSRWIRCAGGGRPGGAVGHHTTPEPPTQLLTVTGVATGGTHTHAQGRRAATRSAHGRCRGRRHSVSEAKE